MFYLALTLAVIGGLAAGAVIAWYTAPCVCGKRGGCDEHEGGSL